MIFRHLALTVLVAASLDAFAAPPDAASAAQGYSLSVGHVYDPDSPTPGWVFILGGVGPIRGGETVCRSLKALADLIPALPRGSRIDWYRTCEGEPDIAESDLDAFKATCRRAGVRLVIHPSG